MNIEKQLNRRGAETLRLFTLFLGVLVVILLTACDSSMSSSPLPSSTLNPPPLPTRTVRPTRTPQPASAPTNTPQPTLIPTVSISPDGWQELRSGVQIREMDHDAKRKTDRVYVVRIDPSKVDFHVRYLPDAPLRVSEWYSTSQALIVMNSSFFDQAHHAVGQLTTDSVSGGQPHDRMDGAFYLTAIGATVWPLRGWVKPPGLQILQSVESFPMLLLPGGLLNPDIANDPRAARRTVVAVDRSGNVLFIVTASGTFTLYGMAVWLANSDLDIDTALNFDGGSSSGLAVWTPQGMWGFDSISQVPAVISVDVKVMGLDGPGGGEWP